MAQISYTTWQLINIIVTVDYISIIWLIAPLDLGQEAVVVKNGSRLCGTGAARASTPILQNKAYWEVKIQQSGIWSCGVGFIDKS